MRKILKSVALSFTLMASLVLLSSCGAKGEVKNIDAWDQAQKTDSITWGVKADTKLFGLMDVKDSQIKGFDIDIAKALTKQMLGKKAKANFIQVTSQTRIPLLKNGNLDAIIATMTITKEREKVVDFSNSYFDAGQSLLVKKGSSIKSVKDLNKPGTKVIGVVGSNSVENIKKFAPKAQVIQLQDYAQALTALKSGQGAALTTDNGILFGMAVDNPNYQVVGKAFTKEPYGIAINKGQGQLKKHLNQALKELEESGEYNKLVEKWFGNIAGFDYKEVER
ncbi:transporter substrate-binding domain-containing protein [Pediococcus pentosaceus]|uniref:transporter substrate-binding domain-containing protein n=1 Tax=Pediococcus pentosaceus TaxID=1255 RepID=UPI00223B507F|nr:transporter substrate-binding domain-containing protein [Pediococcus pentosaceus]MCT1176508.1 glutamine ABC transporter substrate-binding protein [Pediococcus pentosaceus]